MLTSVYMITGNPKRVLLGICGGIAAYKTPELVRELTANDFDVVALLTESSRQFVTETTLTALTNNRVRSELWDHEAERSMSHIQLARNADVLLVAPATTNFLAKAAQGICDDLLTTVYCATEAPVIVAPAMNRVMWAHNSNQRNFATLKKDGVYVIGPNTGDQACGEYGMGRMTEPKDIVEYVVQLIRKPKRELDGMSVVVTAGPTREHLDPVRFVSNASSGKQGYCIAEAAQLAGAKVTLVSGPVDLPGVPGVTRIKVETTSEMAQAVRELIPGCDVFFAVAAVTDFRPTHQHSNKLKRHALFTDGSCSLDFVETEDIVHSVTRSETPTFVVGFAAETESLLENARSKLDRKNLDLVVLNDVSNTEYGIGCEDNEVTVVGRDFEHKIPRNSKRQIAERIIDIVSQRLKDQGP